MAKFTIYWNGNPVPGDKKLVHRVTPDPLIQERLWDTWSCVDAIACDDANYWWLDAEQLADFVEENFLEQSPVFTPLPPWLRDNLANIRIEIVGSFEPAA